MKLWLPTERSKAGTFSPNRAADSPSPPPIPHPRRQTNPPVLELAGERAGLPTEGPAKVGVRGRTGFSLIELMVVVVLIGILSAMVLPAMRGTFEDALLRSTARKLVDALNLASNRAVTINEVHQLHLDRVNHRYSVEQRFHDFQQGRRFVPLHDVPGGAGDLDTRIIIEIQKADEPSLDSPEPRSTSANAFQEQSNPDAITFQPDGTAEAAEILLRDRAGFQLALRLNPTTARVRVVELVRE